MIEYYFIIAMVIILFLLSTGVYLGDIFELYGLATICTILFIIAFVLSWYIIKNHSLGGN